MSAHPHHGADAVVTGELPRANATMNITPMIDVLLVLLVIFMAALPLNQRGIDVNLPPETAPVDSPAPTPQIVLEYTGDRKLSINKQDVAPVGGAPSARGAAPRIALREAAFGRRV